jgi:hypothetical protein
MLSWLATGVTSSETRYNLKRSPQAAMIKYEVIFAQIAFPNGRTEPRVSLEEALHMLSLVDEVDLSRWHQDVLISVLQPF